MLRKILVPFMLLVFVQGHAQRANQNQFWENVRYGGSLGLGFGSNSFNFQAAPSAIYDVNPYYSTGMGLQLNYAKFGDNKFFGYGATWMNFFNPIPMIQLSTELEQWRVNLSNDSPLVGTLEENYWLTSLFLGAGYTQGNITFGIRYDVLFDDQRSIYADPWIPFVRVYF